MPAAEAFEAGARNSKLPNNATQYRLKFTLMAIFISPR
jgi:hypothetical protein